MVEDQLRVGLVGAGRWARTTHAPGIDDHPGTRLVAVWSRRSEAAAELAAPYSAEVMSSPEELVASVDVVAFAVPPSVQAELATTAAAAGRHVILEKPLAADLSSASRLAEEVRRREVCSLVMLTRRFAPETREWLAGLQDGGGWAGGSVTWLSGALLDEGNAGSSWRQEDGGLLDVGPHAVDLVDAALGPVVEVLAAHRSPEDLWQLVFAHEGGATSTLSLSLRFPARPTVTDVSVFGGGGLRALGAPETSRADCYASMLDDFVAMVHSGAREHPCDVARGLHLQRVLSAATSLAGTRSGMRLGTSDR
ncbi:Gfo/Idh/MocA family oxidoreductase [Actinoalloteichus spitiensis]|uniref:Gfo/Idh/MocA family protein n=1 Tax=Actinoalloteichus spitiensis TaxID=252394 RepID=UPI00037FB73E